jgi:hypothetical protein
MTSSASQPSIPTLGTASAVSTSSISGSCDRNASGLSLRFALYCGISARRSLGRPWSNATAIP